MRSIAILSAGFAGGLFLAAAAIADSPPANAPDLSLGSIADDAAADAAKEDAAKHAVTDFDAAVTVKQTTASALSPLVQQATQYLRDCGKQHQWNDQIPADRAAHDACVARETQLQPIYYKARADDQAANARLVTLGMTGGLGETQDQLDLFKSAAAAYRLKLVQAFVDRWNEMETLFAQAKVRAAAKLPKLEVQCFKGYVIDGKSDEEITSRLKRCVEGSTNHADVAVPPGGTHATPNSPEAAIERYRQSGDADPGAEQKRASMRKLREPPSPTVAPQPCTLWQLMTEGPGGACDREVRQPALLAVRG